MIKLTKQFSRERSIFYCSMWRDADLLGFSEFLDYKIKNILFLKKPSAKMSVWLNNEESEGMKNVIRQKMDEKLLDKLELELNRQWKIISPFIIDDKQLDSIRELQIYYGGIVSWWSAMTIIFFTPDIDGISENIKKRALALREDGEKYSDKMDKVFIKFWTVKYEKARDLAQVISPEEIFKLKSDALDRDIFLKLQERLGGFAFLNGKIYSLVDFDGILKKFNLALESEDNCLDTHIIKGVTACAGNTKGRVKLVRLKSQLHQLEEGQILVTEMTDPEYISAIKKSAAIITDEGGVTCHAAIVARELKKPCIIGTKIATQVLHDGDLVEVDADNGIVKIIKKAN